MNSLNAAIEKFTSLKLCTVGERGDLHERPNKVLVLLVAMDLLDEDQATPTQIPWNADFRARFSHYFAQVKRTEDIDSAESQFLNLRNDGIWQAYEINHGEVEPCEAQPTAQDDGLVFASFTDDLKELILDREVRMELRQALLKRYFPEKAEGLI